MENYIENYHGITILWINQLPSNAIFAFGGNSLNFQRSFAKGEARKIAENIKSKKFIKIQKLQKTTCKSKYSVAL